MVVSLLPEYIVGVAAVSYWGTFPLPSVIKQNACKLTYRAILIGLAKWEQIRLPESAQCTIEAEALVWTNYSQSIYCYVEYRPKLMTKA